ncbi:MAG TPA: hypothetical protein VFU13_15025 [Steroidobacteraceae bacterium]|nr:hypothetical protein [Steroidobacteraceae bacterium]
MKPRVSWMLAWLASSSIMSGCGTTVYSVKIPLSERPEAAFADAPHVAIEDMRDDIARETRVSGSLSGCRRWYGDDSYQPPKLVYLDRLIAERVPSATPVHITLDVFDTIEYCDNTANRGAAAAAAGASAGAGMPIIIPANTRPGGDSVHVQLAGEINGVPFDSSRAFDYDGLPYKFTEMPSANGKYREFMRRIMAEIADEIVARLPATPAQ